MPTPIYPWTTLVNQATGIEVKTIERSQDGLWIARIDKNPLQPDSIGSALKASETFLQSWTYAKDKVIFLGSNPSCTSPADEPFSHCKSANNLISSWIPALGLTRDQVEFLNVANYKTLGNRPLSGREIYQEMARLAVVTDGRIVVTLGATAKKAVNQISKVKYSMSPDTVINMPHPSGRNRQLNNKEWVQQMLLKAKEDIQAALTRRKV